MSEFLSENFQFLVVKFSIYLNMRVFVMSCANISLLIAIRFYMLVIHCSKVILYHALIVPKRKRYVVVYSHMYTLYTVAHYFVIGC